MKDLKIQFFKAPDSENREIVSDQLSRCFGVLRKKYPAKVIQIFDTFYQRLFDEERFLFYESKITVIALFNIKGSVGKTSAAVNLAGLSAQEETPYQ